MLIRLGNLEYLDVNLESLKIRFLNEKVSKIFETQTKKIIQDTSSVTCILVDLLSETYELLGNKNSLCRLLGSHLLKSLLAFRLRKLLVEIFILNLDVSLR